MKTLRRSIVGILETAALFFVFRGKAFAHNPIGVYNAITTGLVLTVIAGLVSLLFALTGVKRQNKKQDAVTYLLAVLLFIVLSFGIWIAMFMMFILNVF